VNKSIEVLKRLKVFIDGYKKTFISLFVQRWEDSFPAQNITNKDKRVITKLYDYIFPLDEETNYLSSNEWNDFLKEKDVTALLGSILVDMSSAYIAFLKRKKYDITYMLVFTNRLGEFLLELHKGKIGKIEKEQKLEEIVKEKDIFIQFKSLKEKNVEVATLNLYKGIPLNFNASIIRVSDNFTSIKVHKYQAMAMDLERKTYIKLEPDLEVIKARIISVDVDKQIANITKFLKVTESAFNRTNVRVQPNEAVQVNLYYDNHKLAGWMEEISLRGLSVDSVNLGFLRQGNVIEIRFKLPLNNSKEIDEVFCSGEIVNISSLKKGYRMGILTYPDKIAEQVISKFVYQRQIELIKELHYYCK
jgi:hypothetical protein